MDLTAAWLFEESPDIRYRKRSERDIILSKIETLILMKDKFDSFRPNRENSVYKKIFDGYGMR